MNLDNSIIVVYFVIIFAIAWYHSRGNRTARDYFLGGNEIGWFAIGASLFATNISSEHFIGLAGSGASTGLAVRAALSVKQGLHDARISGEVRRQQAG